MNVLALGGAEWRGCKGMRGDGRRGFVYEQLIALHRVHRVLPAGQHRSSCSLVHQPTRFINTTTVNTEAFRYSTECFLVSLLKVPVGRVSSSTAWGLRPHFNQTSDLFLMAFFSYREWLLALTPSPPHLTPHSATWLAWGRCHALASARSLAVVTPTAKPRSLKITKAI